MMDETLRNTRRKPLERAAKLDWLRLIRSENVGPVTFWKLLSHFGEVGKALEAIPDLARKGGGRTIKIFPKASAQREMEAIEAIGGRLICTIEPDYPVLLGEISDAPPVLSILGHPHLLQQPVIAIVGARNASATGRKFARQISGELGQRGYVIASGMARGIDAQAHEGAIVSGTVAVLAGGADHIYPKENTALYERLRSEGAILAEDPLGTTPQARDFPRRNRIVSGLSAGLLVIEAAKRSGSLISARLAGEQGREVMAVPGSPLDPRCHGTNDLIRNGATLVETADDVIEALEGGRKQPLEEGEGEGFRYTSTYRQEETATLLKDGGTLEDARSQVKELLSPSPVTVDEIVRQCQLSPTAVSLILLEMELASRVIRHPGGQVSLI